jgi:hypothetical protein
MLRSRKRHVYWRFGKVLIRINLLCAGNMTKFFERSRQKGTYHKIAVDIVEVKQPNEFNHMSITEVLQKSKMLYVVYSDRIKEKAWSF